MGNRKSLYNRQARDDNKVMENFRNHFQDHSEIFYLNNGTHSRVPLKVQQAITKYQHEYERNPTAGLFSAWDHLWKVQKELAAFFKAKPTDLFLRTNVTEPLNEFILGQPLPAGSEILTTNQEYGAVFNICRYRSERDGLKLRTLKLPHKKDVQSMKKEDYLDRVVSAISSDTKMLVISEVFTGHGLVLPVLEIAKETAQRGIVLVVDGAHSPGFLDLDFSKFQNIDYYAGNLHKWFMGPKGTGFGWVNPKRQAELKPLQIGWVNYEITAPFLGFAEGHRFAVSKLMLGCHDFSDFFALSETVQFWQELGPRQIYDRIRKLGVYLNQEVEKNMGLFHFAPRDESCRGPLHSYLLPARFQSVNYAQIMKEILETTKTQVAITGIDEELYMRLSPHIYNSEQEISEALQRLAHYFR